jgi:hypothetical protein
MVDHTNQAIPTLEELERAARPCAADIAKGLFPPSFLIGGAEALDANSLCGRHEFMSEHCPRFAEDIRAHELSYRRGANHAVCAAFDLVASVAAEGGTFQDVLDAIADWERRIYAWRCAQNLSREDGMPMPVAAIHG